MDLNFEAVRVLVCEKPLYSLGWCRFLLLTGTDFRCLMYYLLTPVPLEAGRMDISKACFGLTKVPISDLKWGGVMFLWGRPQYKTRSHHYKHFKIPPHRPRVVTPMLSLDRSCHSEDFLYPVAVTFDFVMKHV